MRKEIYIILYFLLKYVKYATTKETKIPQGI